MQGETFNHPNFVMISSTSSMGVLHPGRVHDGVVSNMYLSKVLLFVVEFLYVGQGIL